MITLKELKERKQVKASRIDYNFVSNEEKIANFENQVKAENLEIAEKEKVNNNIEYVLIKHEETEHKFSMASWHETDGQKDEFMQECADRIEKSGLKVLNKYRDNDFVYVVTDANRIYFTVPLNNPDRKKEMDGILVFRSNDYYFQYVNDNNEVKKVYGDISAKNIHDNKLIFKDDEWNLNLEYIMEI